MDLRFSKMHGLGNDFMVIDMISQDIALSAEKVRDWSNRHTGIGFDQLLLLQAPSDPACDFRYRIHNADGSEVEHCGNGIRCIARFAYEQGLTHKKELRFQLPNGIVTTQLLDDGMVRVNMGAPVFEPVNIPFQADSQAAVYALDVEGETCEISALSMGNPHAVMVIEDALKAPVLTLGPAIERHPRFPQRVNAGFMQVMNPGYIRLRVYERGVGETEACGTGACAAVVAGITRELLDNQVEVELIGGMLQLEWQGGNSPVMMTGPTATVYEGQLVND